MGNSLPYKISNQASSFSLAESISGLSGSPLVKVYPNPFTNAFVLQLENLYMPGTVATIVDIQGRMISSVKPSGTTLLLGGSLQKGVYLIQVWQDDAVVFTQKIVKQ